MALTNTQYDTIIRVYNKKQLQNRRDQESRIALAEKELPELSKINEEIASLSMKCARRLLNDEPASLDELKTEINAYGQHRKILLKNAGFPEDFLEMHYTCPDCKDTGYIGNEKCHCFRQAAINLLYTQSNLTSVLEYENFDHFCFHYYPETMNDHVTGSAEESSLQSFFGRLNYNYGGRYLLEMNVRHDGSSRMPKAHRYATFPSFSGAWIMTNEKFMENVKFLHSLKLRGSWGKLGNQEIGNYAYAATLAASGSYYFGDSKQIGMKTAKIPNENIKWETTTITDFGFDAAFWGGKINVTFDWYEKNTSDILMKLAMPGIFLGSLDAPYQNAGKVRNRGWELAANYFDQKGDWAWQAGFSLSGVKNEITDMKGVEDIKDNTINREGEAIGSYYGLKAIGIYRTQADLDRVNANGQKIMQNNQEPQLGDIMYEDIDNNGNINDADRTIIGNPFPKMQYSFNLGFSYKDFDVNTFWQGIAGVYRYNWDETTISNGGNKTSRWLDRWSESNPNGSMPRLGGTINNNYSSFWLTKGDYLRLKNLEIGYTFRQREFLTKLGVQSLRLYLAGTNLLTFTSLDDYDPEKLSTDSRNDVHPNTRTYSFGVNVKF